MTDMPTDLEIARAQRHARAAARADLAAGRRPDPRRCPFNADGDGRERVLARRWVQAFVQALPDSGASLVDFDEPAAS